MPCRRRFGAVRCREGGTPITWSALLSLLGMALAAAWFILFVAWAVDLARLANSAGSEKARVAVDVRRMMPSPPHDAGETPGADSCAKAALHRRPWIGENPRTHSGLPATAINPMMRVERCLPEDAPVGAFVLATPDLRCELAAMAASQRRTGFIYVGPR